MCDLDPFSKIRSHFLLHLQTPLMMLVWTSRPEASGVGARMNNYFDGGVFYPNKDVKKREYGH